MWNLLCGIACSYLALLGAQYTGCNNDTCYLSLLLGFAIGWMISMIFEICFDDDDDDMNGYV